MSDEAGAKWSVGTSACVSINLDKRACIENRVVSTDIHEQAMRS